MGAINEKIDIIKNLIALDMPKDALEEIRSMEYENIELRNELTLIEARFNSYCSEMRKNTTSQEDLSRTRQQINQALLSFCNRILSYDKINEKNRTKLNFQDLSIKNIIIFSILFGAFVALLKFLISMI